MKQYLLLMFFAVFFIGIGISNATNYCVGASANYTCGGTIAQSCTLNGNLNCSETAFIIGASNIVVDGAGYQLAGQDSGGTSYGFSLGTYDNVTIKNFNMVDKFDQWFLIGNGGNNNIITNNNLTTTRGGDEIVYLSGADYTTISNNNFNGGDNIVYGIGVAINNNITNNTGVNIGNFVRFIDGSIGNYVFNNSVLGDTTGIGFYLQNTTSQTNIIKQNYFGNFLYGVQFNPVYDNAGANITSNTIENCTRGITSYSATSAVDIGAWIFNNTVTNNQYGIYFIQGTTGRIITMLNNIVTYSDRDGIKLTVGHANSKLNNTISCFNNQSGGAYYDLSQSVGTETNSTCDLDNPNTLCDNTCTSYFGDITINDITITPSNPLANAQLNCSFNVTDNNALNVVNVTLNWFNGTNYYKVCSYNNVTHNALYLTNSTCNIPSSITATGETWKCNITAINGYETERANDTVTILGATTSETYNSTIYETISYPYQLVTYHNEPSITTASAFLTWNNNNYTATATIDNPNKKVTYNVTIETPLLTANNTLINHTWNYTMDSLNYKTNITNQTALWGFYPSSFTTTPASINEGGNSTSTMNVTSLLTTPILFTTALQWHTTNYSFPLQSNSSNWFFYNATIPTLITGLTSINTTGYLTVIYGNQSKVRTLNSNQTITNYIIFNCSSATTNITLNFTIYDESIPATAIVSNLSGTIYYWYSNKNSKKNITFAYTGANAYYFCLNSSENLTVEANLEFKPNLAGYTTVSAHHYYLFNTLISTTMKSYALYNLNLTTANSLLRLTILDSNTLIPKTDVLTKMNRYYAGTSYLWYPVQYFLSDSFGLTLFDIFEKDKTYSFDFYDKNNCLLKQANLSFFSCTSGVCEYSALIGDCTIATTSANNSITWSFDNATKIINVFWADPTGQTKTVQMIVTNEKANERVEICNQITSSSMGTMQCALTNNTGTISLWVLDSASPTKPVIMEYITIPTLNLASLIGEREGAFWSFLILTVFVCAGVIISPVATVVTTVLGLVVILWIGLWNPVTLTLIIGVGVIATFIAIKVRY